MNENNFLNALRLDEKLEGNVFLTAKDEYNVTAEKLSTFGKVWMWIKDMFSRGESRYADSLIKVITVFNKIKEEEWADVGMTSPDNGIVSYQQLDKDIAALSLFETKVKTYEKNYSKMSNLVADTFKRFHEKTEAVYKIVNEKRRALEKISDTRKDVEVFAKQIGLPFPKEERDQFIGSALDISLLLQFNEIKQKGALSLEQLQVLYILAFQIQSAGLLTTEQADLSKYVEKIKEIPSPSLKEAIQREKEKGPESDTHISKYRRPVMRARNPKVELMNESLRAREDLKILAPRAAKNFSDKDSSRVKDPLNNNILTNNLNFKDGLFFQEDHF